MLLTTSAFFRGDSARRLSRRHRLIIDRITKRGCRCLVTFYHALLPVSCLDRYADAIFAAARRHCLPFILRHCRHAMSFCFYAAVAMLSPRRRAFYAYAERWYARRRRHMRARTIIFIFLQRRDDRELIWWRELMLFHYCAIDIFSWRVLLSPAPRRMRVAVATRAMLMLFALPLHAAFSFSLILFTSARRWRADWRVLMPLYIIICYYFSDAGSDEPFSLFWWDDEIIYAFRPLRFSLFHFLAARLPSSLPVMPPAPLTRRRETLFLRMGQAWRRGSCRPRLFCRQSSRHVFVDRCGVQKAPPPPRHAQVEPPGIMRNYRYAAPLKATVAPRVHARARRDAHLFVCPMLTLLFRFFIC